MPEPVAILVVDMASFTRLTAEKGALAAEAAIEAFQERCAAFVEAFAGRIEKFDADNCFATFPDARLATSAALAITADRGSSAGVGFGPLETFHADLLGDELNRASKLGEDIARHGQVLLTDAAKAALKTPT